MFAFVGVVVQMKMLHGALKKVKKEHPTLLSKGLPYARKLGFPDIIMPGSVIPLYLNKILIEIVYQVVFNLICAATNEQNGGK